jgi:hypothetical protein
MCGKRGRPRKNGVQPSRMLGPFGVIDLYLEARRCGYPGSTIKIGPKIAGCFRKLEAAPTQLGVVTPIPHALLADWLSIFATSCEQHQRIADKWSM